MEMCNAIDTLQITLFLYTVQINSIEIHGVPVLIQMQPIQGSGLGSDSQHIWCSDRQKTVIRKEDGGLHCLQILDFAQCFSHPPLQE